MTAALLTNSGTAKAVGFVAAAMALPFGAVALAADPDCKQYQRATTLPAGFDWDGNAMLKPAPGKRVGPEVNYYSNGSCVCATRLPKPYNSDFPGTPKDATLSCVTEKEYRAMLPSGVK